jgi:predicted 3-demethylubiquinone-9 3-methyltransferase (glyoxalase superfamily)
VVAPNACGQCLFQQIERTGDIGVDELWQKLSQGGETQRCGWLKDKHGISWQIIPSALGEMLQDKDDEKSERVMKAMLQMDKIDIRGLKQANDG